MEHHYRLTPLDLFDSVYDVDGTIYEIVYVTHPATKPEATNSRRTPERGDEAVTAGWRGRRKSTRSDRGHDRRQWLTRPSGTPQDAADALRKYGYISAPTKDS